MEGFMLYKGETSYKNEDKLKYEQVMGPKFVLANSYEQAREFWSEFDKIYPHFLLERVMEEGGNLNKMMIIFKNFMQEVVEITMNVCAERSSGKHIRCCISCNVVHRHIDLEGAEGKWLDVLALAVRGTRHPMLAHFDRMLDLDTSMITNIQLQDTFNEIYNALPNEATEIDDTGNNSAAGKRLATVNESKPEHKAHSDRPNAAAKSNKEDKKQQIVETKTEKTVITTKTKTVTRDGKVVEQNEETKEVKLKSDPSSENIKTQPKPLNQQESAGQREVKIKTEPKANEEDDNVNADEQPDLD